MHSIQTITYSTPWHQELTIIMRVRRPFDDQWTLQKSAKRLAYNWRFDVISDLEGLVSWNPFWRCWIPSFGLCRQIDLSFLFAILWGCTDIWWLWYCLSPSQHFGGGCPNSPDTIHTYILESALTISLVVYPGPGKTTSELRDKYA